MPHKTEYTAAELTCRAGQVVRGEKETHGWVFCRLQDGSAGWIPRKNLEANGG
ncbi:SH3 domain-containing protein [Bacillus altitudinis]|uniref:SH3 domain-containing protein n=1 Tax=Bacillus altitudinis TaxID=293387 RepID=UPI003CFC3CF5